MCFSTSILDGFEYHTLGNTTSVFSLFGVFLPEIAPNKTVFIKLQLHNNKKIRTFDAYSLFLRRYQILKHRNKSYTYSEFRISYSINVVKIVSPYKIYSNKSEISNPNIFNSETIFPIKFFR